MPIEIGFNPSGSGLQLNSEQDISSLDPKLSRSNYFDGRLLRASDLTRDQLYLDERLREVGRAIGSGIVRGLQVTLADADTLSVEPGLAVAPSGRVLELADEQLKIRLQDAAAIASLNPDSPQRISRGLYAVALQLLEIGTDSAEVYPRDLEGQRGFHFNAWSEGVELVLIPLRNALPNATANKKSRLAGQNSLSARSALVREFIANDGQPADLPEDAVALGLLAIEHGRVLWLDRGLVRRPHRHPHAQNALQADLHRHYQELLNEVLQWRLDSSLRGEFPASHYFRVLPPYGNLPKTTLNPETGRQAWFPSGYEVSIAPVREDDLPAILAESAALDPIDLEKDDDVDVMVLVPLSDHQFAWRARQLQHRGESVDTDAHTALPHLDRLALRLYQAVETPIDETDAAIWRAIWSDAEQPIYVRRPPRVAETLVSGVVLAAGYDPEIVYEEGPPPDLANMEERVIALEDQRDALQRNLDRALAEIELLENGLGDTDDERLELARAEIETLRAQLATAAGNAQELAELRTQYDTQLALIENQRQEIAALRDGIPTPDPDPSPDPTPDPGADPDTALLEAQITELQNQLADANSRIIELQQQLAAAGNVIPLPSIRQLAELRAAVDQARGDATALAAAVGENEDRLLAVHQLAQLIGPRYDSLFYATLAILVERGTLQEFRDILQEMLASGSGLGDAMMELLPGFGADTQLGEQWAELDASFSGGGNDQQRIDELQGQITDLNGQLTQQDITIAQLQAQLAAAGNNTQLRNQITQLQQDLAKAEQQIADLGGQQPFSIDFAAVKTRPIEEWWEERAPAMDRHPDNDAIKLAAEQVITRANSNPIRLARATQILTITPPKYDPALWRTLYTVLGQNDGTNFRDFMYEVRVAGANPGLAVAATRELSLAQLIRNLWIDIDLPG